MPNRNVNFDGTSMSGAHVGDHASNNAWKGLDREASEVVLVSYEVGTEAANAIAVDIAIQDRDGNALAETVRLACRVYDADMVEALVAAWTMAETGAGVEVSTTAQPALLIDTDENGVAQVTVTDVSGAYAGDVYLEIKPVDREGAAQMVVLTFT